MDKPCASLSDFSSTAAYVTSTHFFGKLDVSGAGKCHRFAGTSASDAVLQVGGESFHREGSE